jgi:hypothetical protein
MLVRRPDGGRRQNPRQGLYPRTVKLWRGVATAMGAGVLVLVSCAPLVDAVVNTTAPVPQATAPSAFGAPRSPAPAPGPCLQNAARCSNAGSLVSTGAPPGLALVLIGGAVIVDVALLRRLRRLRGAPGSLPSGRAALIMRPPRSLPAFA